MKKHFSTILLLFLAFSVFSQEIVKNREYFSAKSKRQRSGGGVMLIGGAALIGAGFLIGDRKESSFDDAATGAILGGVGVLLMVGSVPVFIASSKNKRKAVSFSFKNIPIPKIKNSSMVYQSMPAVSIQLSL